MHRESKRFNTSGRIFRLAGVLRTHTNALVSKVEEDCCPGECFLRNQLLRQLGNGARATSWLAYLMICQLLRRGDDDRVVEVDTTIGADGMEEVVDGRESPAIRSIKLNVSKNLAEVCLGYYHAVPWHVARVRDICQHHCSIQFIRHHFQYSRYAFSASRCQSPAYRATDKNSSCSQGQCFQNVSASSETSIDKDFGFTTTASTISGSTSIEA